MKTTYIKGHRSCSAGRSSSILNHQLLLTSNAQRFVMNKSILLQGGTVLTHSSDEHVVPLYNADVLVTGNLIAEVGKSIHVSSADTEVIDCHGKIISPGFVDTHHHLWQTQLKGRHADEGLAAYMVSGKYLVSSTRGLVLMRR